MKSFSRMFMIVMLMAMWGSVASAEEGYQTAASPDAKAGAEKQAMMEKMKKMTSPSEAHKILEPLAGKWTYTSKFWMAPDGKPEESSGTAEDSMIFGGRFLKEDFKGTWMNQPFEGLGYMGYDNIKEEYVDVWLDNMATSIMKMSGTYDAAKKTLTFTGTNSCPLTGEKDRKGRSELVITDNDHHAYFMYMNGADGKEFKAMEINYQRAQ